jgi:hypothetical protein
MRLLSTGVALLALGGCASTQAILADAPDEVATSSKSAEAVAFCIGEKNMAAPFNRQDGSYVISIKSAVGVTGLVYTVLPDGTGSKVEVRRANSPVSVTKFRNCL